MICLNASIDLNFCEEKVFRMCKTCVSKDVWKVKVKATIIIVMSCAFTLMCKVQVHCTGAQVHV